MTTQAWASFAWWKEQYDRDDVALDEPFANAPWTPETCFVWTKVVEPVAPGMGEPSGYWSVFPHAQAVAGVLRHVLLPDWAGAWLERDSWDDDPDAFRSLDDLLRASEDAPVPAERRDAVDTLRAVAEGLDRVLAGDPADAARALAEPLAAFNERFRGTGSWEFQVHVHVGPLAVGRELIERLTEYLGEGATEEQIAEALGATPAVFLQHCELTLTDEDARDDLLAALDEDSF